MDVGFGNMSASCETESARGKSYVKDGEPKANRLIGCQLPEQLKEIADQIIFANETRGLYHNRFT